MVRSLLLPLATAAATSWPHPKKPDFLTIDFVVNFIDGLTNDQHDLRTCILGGLQPIGDLVTAVTEVKKAIQDRGCPVEALTEFVKAIEALEDFLDDVRPALVGCMAPAEDAKADIAVLKSFSSIKDLMRHIEDDFAKDDGDKIATGLEDAFRAYFQKDYGTFGGDLGTALYRMIISPKYPDEMGTTTQAPTEPPSDACAAGVGVGACDIEHLAVHKGACQNGKNNDGIQCLAPELYDDYVCPAGLFKCKFQNLAQLGASFPHPEKPEFLSSDFVVNFLDALTNDNHDLETCISGGLQAMGDFDGAVTDVKKAIHDRKEGHKTMARIEFLKGVHELEDFLHEVHPAYMGCAPPVQDAKADIVVLKSFSSMKDLIRHIEQDVLADEQCKILSELEAAFQAYSEKDYGSFGTDLGTALYRMLISPTYPDEKAVVV